MALCLVVGGTVVDDAVLLLVVGVAGLLLLVEGFAAFSPVPVSGGGLNIIHNELTTN